MQQAKLFYKDEVLDSLANRSNVAQFVSFSPTLHQRYCRIAHHAPNHQFQGAPEAINSLLEAAPEHKVNIRTFVPSSPQGGPFLPGFKNTSDVLDKLNSLAADGIYTIVNESIDTRDGGVSGVIQGGIAEFAPWQNPRCVENKDVASMPRDLAFSLLSKVYGFKPALKYPESVRVEFSVHPVERGFRNEKTIVWEEEKVSKDTLSSRVKWPNDFSRLLGDKVFGLLIADSVGLPVPHTLVIARHVPPFEFGTKTKSGRKWVRPCPTEKVPGVFTTVRGWTDPFALVAREDSDAGNIQIQSVLVQDEVPAVYSGALITSSEANPILDGVKGFGDDLMLGVVGPSSLPKDVSDSVLKLYKRVHNEFGSLRLEWVFDGKQTWVVQLQQEASYSFGDVIFPGTPDCYVDFDSSLGVMSLRKLVSELKESRKGVRVIGHVGMTSHIADTLREARIPSIRQQSQMDLPLDSPVLK